MSIFDVIRHANEFVYRQTGQSGEPAAVRKTKAGNRDEWRLFYEAQLFYPDIYREGGVIDGGEYIVTVDDVTGDVTVLNH